MEQATVYLLLFAVVASVAFGQVCTEVVMQDDFTSTPDGTITDEFCYNHATFPDAGTSSSANPSALWEMDSGSFYCTGQWGDTKTEQRYFRLNTRNKNAKEATVTWKYKAYAWSSTSSSSDAVDIWLRYQSQFNLYIIQFDRKDGKVVAKRKIPAYGRTPSAVCPDSDISNQGVYYALAPSTGTAHRWDTVYPDGAIVHDGATVYAFKSTVTTLANGNVELKLWRNGVLAATWVDDGDTSGIAASGYTQGQQIRSGCFNSLAWWTSSIGLPITNAGATGFRSDNVRFLFDDYKVENTVSCNGANNATSSAFGATSSTKGEGETKKASEEHQGETPGSAATSTTIFTVALLVVALLV